MRIAKESTTVLTVSANKHARLRLAGFVALGLGLAVIFLVRVQPLDLLDLQEPALLRQQQEGQPELEPDFAEPSISETGYRLAFYFGRLLFTRERPVVVVALLGVITGLFILAGPYHSRKATFNKARQQVTLKEPRWFFRSKVEVHSFEQISEVRVERDWTTGGSERNYGVNLIISHSEGAPLSSDYIHYKTVFLLSESYKYNYQMARDMVDRIGPYLAETGQGVGLDAPVGEV